MLKYELSTALKSKRVMFLFLFFILLTSFDLYANYRYSFGEYLRGVASKPTGVKVLHPCFAGFLSAANIGHLSHVLMTWAFPLYPLFAYSDSFALQKQYGYYNVLLTKTDRKKVVSSRFMAAFLIPFFIALVSLFLNLGAANILFKGGASFAGLEADLGRPLTTDFEKFMILNPYVTYIAYIFVFSIVMGLYGMFCAGVCFMIPRYAVLYPAVFFTWFALMNIPYSILSVMQSFADYSSSEMIVSSIYYTLMVAVTTVAAYIYKVRYDEL